MKRIDIMVIGLLVVFATWGSLAIWQKESEQPKRPSEMTAEEREAELRRTLDQLDIELPENWSSMDRQERGEFLLQKEVLTPEMMKAFEDDPTP